MDILILRYINRTTNNGIPAKGCGIKGLVKGPATIVDLVVNLERIISIIVVILESVGNKSAGDIPLATRRL